MDLIVRETVPVDGPAPEEDGSEEVSCFEDCGLDLVGGGSTVI